MSKIIHGGLAVCVLLAATGLASAADAPLVDAVKRQDRAAVRALLSRKVNVNTPAPDGSSALHWAVHRDDRDTVEQLLKAGANVNATNEYGVTPLSLACTNANAPLVEALLKAGADANLALPTGETPLMTAAFTGNAAVVRALLDRGAQVNAAEPEKKHTPLMWALAERHLAAATLLVERGANVNAKTTTGFTPLMFAARHGDVDAGRMLIAKGASINAAGDDGVTVLLVAVLRDHAPFAQLLLDAGADPKADSPGYTALHWATGRWESSMTHDYPAAQEHEWQYLGGMTAGRLDLIRALIAHGADVNARIKKSPPRYGINLFSRITLNGATPFFLAAFSADVETMKLLLAKGADPTLNNVDGVTPLMGAAGLGRVPGDSLIPEAPALEATKLCVELGLDLNAATTLGETALHGTAYYGLDSIAEYLVKAGANINPKNKKGETPLKVADGYIQAAMVLSRPTTAAVLRKLGATY